MENLVFYQVGSGSIFVVAYVYSVNNNPDSKLFLPDQGRDDLQDRYRINLARPDILSAPVICIIFYRARYIEESARKILEQG